MRLLLPARLLHVARRLASSAVLVLAAAGAWAQGEAAAPAGAQALLQRSIEESPRDPEAGHRLAEQALEQLRTQPDADIEMRVRLQLCDYHAERDRGAAMAQIEQARALLARLQRPGLRAGLLGCEGEVREYAGENTEAMALFEQAVTVASQARDDEMLAGALYQRGYLRGVQGDFALGLADLQRAVELYERQQRERESVNALNAVAILYNRLGDHAQARRHFERSLQRQRDGGWLREQAVTQHNLARVIENQRDWPAAMRAFESVVALSREVGYARGEAYGLRGIASVRNAQREPRQALAMLQRAEALQRTIPDERLRGQILLQRGIALRQLGRAAEAATVLREALAVFRQAQSLAEVGQAHGELSTALADQGEWRAAHEQQVLHQEASDALLRRQLDDRYELLKVEFDFAARERENRALQRERDATALALQREQQANALKAAVLALAGLLLGLLGLLAWRQRRSHLQMLRLAMTDDLTGLPNRRAVIAQLEAALAQGAPAAVLIADLDRFKSINDSLGHLVGDEVLRSAAQALREAVRSPAAVGRLGGEEFLVVLPGAAAGEALQAAERLRAAVAACDVSRWLPERSISISLGVAVRRPDDTTATMLRRADEALYEAKAAGRDRAVLRDDGAAPAR